MRFVTAEGEAPPSRKGLWVAIILAIIALGLLTALLVVLFGGSGGEAGTAVDGGKVVRDAAAAVDAPAIDAATTAAPDGPGLASSPAAAPVAPVSPAVPATPPPQDAGPAPVDVAAEDAMVEVVDGGAEESAAEPDEASEAADAPPASPDAGPQAATEPETIDVIEAGPEDAAAEHRSHTRRDAGHRPPRDAGRDDARNSVNLRPFDGGNTPIIVTSPKDVGR